MSIVIRFNTTLVRKQAIAAAPASKLSGLREYLLEKREHWYEDSDLLAVSSMGACMVDTYLEEWGLRNGIDFCGSNQSDGSDIVGWLEHTLRFAVAACWLAGKAADYLVDTKPIRTMKRWAASNCPHCGREIGLEAAGMAIHPRERDDGPLAFVDADPQNGVKWVIRCLACSNESLGTAAGSLQAQTSL